MALEARPVKNSKPNFVLTKKKPITVIRATAGAYVGGRWMNGGGVEVSILANVQPLRFHEIMQLPESDRTKEWIKIYSAEQMFTSQESDVDGREADIVKWDNKEYKIMACRHYEMGVLDHYHSLAARVPVSAL